MNNFYEVRNRIVEFLNESNISAYDLARISKLLCTCRTCRFFVQHYSKGGMPLDFGHCIKSNMPKMKKPDMGNCGFWDLDEEGGDGK